MRSQNNVDGDTNPHSSLARSVQLLINSSTNKRCEHSPTVPKIAVLGITFECLRVQDRDFHTDFIYMTAVPATVILTDKKGDCYRVLIHIKSRRFRGAFNNLHFGENIPATGSYADGNLELGYYQDPGFKAGDSFPLWSD